jgi:hypothetical protein
MDDLTSSGFAEFDRLAELFRRTHRLLDALSSTGSVPEGGTDVLATETLPHVEDIEEGFRIALRASAAELSELRQLVIQAGIGQGEPRDEAERRAALVQPINRSDIFESCRSPSPAPQPRQAAR